MCRALAYIPQLSLRVQVCCKAWRCPVVKGSALSRHVKTLKPGFVLAHEPTALQIARYFEGAFGFGHHFVEGGADCEVCAWAARAVAVDYFPRVHADACCR